MMHYQTLADVVWLLHRRKARADRRYHQQPPSAARTDRMCKKQLQAEIAAHEVTEGTVTYCTLPSWQQCRKEIRNSRTKNFAYSCWCCGRGIDESKGGVAYVHMRIFGGLFRVDSEMTEEYYDKNSQGWFPVGSACKKNYPGYFRVFAGSLQSD